MCRGHDLTVAKLGSHMTLAIDGMLCTHSLKFSEINKGKLVLSIKK